MSLDSYFKATYLLTDCLAMDINPKGKCDVHPRDWKSKLSGVPAWTRDRWQISQGLGLCMFERKDDTILLQSDARQILRVRPWLAWFLDCMAPALRIAYPDQEIMLICCNRPQCSFFTSLVSGWVEFSTQALTEGLS
jgi:hypothetical protein